MLPKSLLNSVAFKPRSLSFPNAWVGHLPFAAWVIRELAPHTFVELGTHSGNSYFTFCQAVAEAGIATRCYAVDTWKGDEHANHYSEDVFAQVTRHHQEHYAGFSRLLRTTFDEAVTYFPDEGVDLIHIDGLHTYDAVRYDFETWLPKLAPGAVVLFHDTNVRDRNFGVWKFWRELQAAYPNNLEFVHSHGLGVLQLNDAPANKQLTWLRPGSEDQAAVLDFFTALGAWHLASYDLMEMRQEAIRLHGVIGELNGHVGRLNHAFAERNAQVGHLEQLVSQRDQQIASLTHAVAEREAEMAALRASTSWRITAPLRAMRGGGGGGDRQAAQPAPAPSGSDEPEPVPLASLFDADWYLETNHDVRDAQLDPLAHFAENGWREGRSPHPLFSTRWYVDSNPDVREAEVNPLEHFLTSGWKEGRSPHPLFDTRWYLENNPDVRSAGVNPLEHFLTTGWQEGRRPHSLFDTAWYLQTNPQVKESGINPLVHYAIRGGAELRDPCPAFDAALYVAKHPEAADNPLLFHITIGASKGFAIGRGPDSEPEPVDISDYLPRPEARPTPAADVTVDVIIPVYRGLHETRRCLESVLADHDRPAGTIRVIDDCSPEPELSAWLASLAATGRIELSRNERNLGFVATVNLGMTGAGRNDVLLLNSDTEVPGGFLRRLAAHAYASPKVATVTPFSNYAGEMCSYPTTTGAPMPEGFSLKDLDEACRTANGQRAIELPTGRGLCLYIRRACLDEIGAFDEEAFGRGYGEETDFCLRAGEAGWRHLLACDTFVYHAGQVSFGDVAPERDSSWHTLTKRHPGLAATLVKHRALAPEVPPSFAATARLFSASKRPTVLMIGHRFDAATKDRLHDAFRSEDNVNLLLVCPSQSGLELSIPTLPGHAVLRVPNSAVSDLNAYARACGVSRVHIQHWVGLGEDVHRLIDQLGAPVEMTMHDYA